MKRQVISLLKHYNQKLQYLENQWADSSTALTRTISKVSFMGVSPADFGCSV